MRDSSRGTDERGNLERVGESAGAIAGRAADVGMEMTGALFRSAAQMLGGWWSSDAPQQAAGSWSDRAERDCRSHFQASAGATDTGGSMKASGSVGGVSGSVSANASTTDAGHVAPKSQRAAMQSAGELTSADAASDGFERARPGYQLGYVARQNPAYSGRSFSEVEPELQRVWESRSRTTASDTGSSSSWPEVRGFVDFAYQQDTDRR